ncbi:MAG: sugar O-acetyltransferase [Gemella haemolysans]|uniref:sugar O-acetyltransferase n=1 Tax=Gemella haemolysans TaxID=1379 RepID=UPI003FA0D31C
MNQKERMIAGLPYKADKELSESYLRGRDFCFRYNNVSPLESEKRKAMIKSFFSKTGEKFAVLSPFYCDYGFNISIGEYFFSNYNLVILDVAPVTIGDNVMFGPNVSLFTAGHPIHPVSRNSGYEYGLPITIGNNVWLGGNVVVTPGVTIGENSVIGAGSVVVKDIPANVVAAGNPCEVIRKINDKEIDYVYKDKLFDVDDCK